MPYSELNPQQALFRNLDRSASASHNLPHLLQPPLLATTVPRLDSEVNGPFVVVNVGTCRQEIVERLRRKPMMFISATRRKLQAAIQAATDPMETAALATSLARLIDAEGRAKGRRQRQKARTAEAKDNRQTVLDPGSEFFLD
jgi:hypothetical protein